MVLGTKSAESEEPHPGGLTEVKVSAAHAASGDTRSSACQRGSVRRTPAILSPHLVNNQLPSVDPDSDPLSDFEWE